MIGRLIQKELLNHLLDHRFVAIFLLCALLSVLGVYIGVQNYLRMRQQHQTVTHKNREHVQKSIERGGWRGVTDLIRVGILWNRPPEVLSPLIFGLSGKVGQEVVMKHQRMVIFEDSLFSVDPVNALLGVLDFRFIVKVILSLCVLLLIHDAVCGEKEAGTLRLYASYPVPRSTLALAKLVGSTVAVLLPFAFAYTLAVAVLTLHPELDLKGQDWARMAVLMVLFGLYLTVFAAFGLWVSSATHRRMTAFLGLLGLWTVWIFVLPDLAVRIAQWVVPVDSIYAQEKQRDALRWTAMKGSRDEREAYESRNAVADREALTDAQRARIQEARAAAFGSIEAKWNAELYARVAELRASRRNQMRRQQNLTLWLSALSPYGAATFTSMDLARTGIAKHDRIEDALNAYLITLSQFISSKLFEGDADLSDFSWFVYEDTETLGSCLSRNAFHILNLALLAVLGFAGAFVTILRYDVR